MCGVSGTNCPANYKGTVRAVRVELTTVANQSQYTLPDLAVFKGAFKVLGFSHRSFVSGRKTMNNKALVNLPQQKVSHLQLKKANGNDSFMEIPLENINNDLSGYRDIYWLNEPIELDMASSNVICADTSLIVAGEAYELIVYTTDNC